ncbi:MAG: PadR family transcriptional regulator [Chloroflexi bacterium]|nr:PadR family transcriptional regulator [Chloroflexota bacterium]
MSDAELTILSLVAEGPRYGFEIQKMVEDRGLREWLIIGFSSVYYILNRLERQKLIRSHQQTIGGQARKVYEISDAGRGVLQTRVADLLRQPRALGTGFELGLANLGVLKPQQVFKVLKAHRQDLQQRLEAVEKAWHRHQLEENLVADNIQALYTHSIAVMRAELDWITVFLETWRARYPNADETVEMPNVPVPGEATQRSRPTVNNDPAKVLQRLKRPNLPKGE